MINILKQHRTSLAVLPFDNFTGKVEQDYFSRGFVQDIITDLSKFQTLQVISSQTSLSDNLKPDKETASKLKIKYFLKGNLRLMEDNLRINSQLLDPFSSSIIWAERYDAKLKDVFAVQDSIVEKVVSSLSLKIDSNRLHIIRNKPITHLESYDCWLKGLEFLRQGTIKDDEKARQIFKRALQIDPHYGRAYAGISLSYFNEWNCQMWERWETNVTQAYKYALEANKLSSTDHVIQMILGRILLYKRKFKQAEVYLNRALDLNPNDADNLVQIAGGKALLGKEKDAEKLFHKAIRLNPYHLSWYKIYEIMILFSRGKYKELVKTSEDVQQILSVDQPAYIAASYALLSDIDKAKHFAKIFLKQFKEKISFGRKPSEGEPLEWILHVNPYKKDSVIKVFKDGLEKAGLEKGTENRKFFHSELIDATSPPNHIINRNGIWEISYNNLAIQIPEMKGFFDLAKLLANPNTEFHSSDLMGNITSTSEEIDVIDTKAKNDYKKKIAELKEEINEANEINDIGRAELLNEQMQYILDHLKKSTGIGGRTRKILSPSDKARSAVTLRIKSAIKKIEPIHPQLAKHLNNAIQTGTFCKYSPETEQNWQIK